MATITAALGGGTWDASTGGTWVGGVAPTANDDVLLTGTSGNITIASGAVCNSLNCTGYTGTLTHTAAVTLTIGSATAGLSNVALTLVSGMTYTLGNTSTSAISFVSTSATQQSIDCGGKAIGAPTFNGAGGSWQFTSAVSIVNASTGIITLTAGSLDTNGQTIVCGVFSSSNTNVRSWSLGASTVTLGNFQGTPINFATSTNMTFNAGTSSVTSAASTNSSHQMGGFTWYNVTFTTGGGGLFQANTFNNLTINGTGFGSQVSLEADQVVNGLFTASGGNANNQRILIGGGDKNAGISTGITRKITAASVSLTNADFQDINGAGAATWSGTSIGDAGGNTNISFDAPLTLYWVATAGGSWSNTTSWSLSSGGSSGARVPLSQDEVIFDANSITSTGKTITCNVVRMGKDIDMSAVLNSPIIAFTSTGSNLGNTILGSFLLGSGMTSTGTNTVLFWGRATHTFNSNGVTFLGTMALEGAGSTYTLTGNLTVSNKISFNNGTVLTNGFSVTCTEFISTVNNTTHTINWGSSSLTLTGTGTILDVRTATFLTWIAGTSTITVSDTSATAKSFSFDSSALGWDIYNMVFAGGSGIVTWSGTIRVNGDLTINAPANIALAKNVTKFIKGNFNATGNSTNEITITSDTPGTAATLSKYFGVVSCDWLSLKDSKASGGADWYAGANSTSVSGNSGWIFTVPPSNIIDTGEFVTTFDQPGYYSELVATRDQVNVAIAYQVSVSDNTSTSENITVRETSFISVSENETTSETLTLLESISINVSDNTVTSETVNVEIVNNASVSDNTVTSESLTLLEVSFVNVSNNVTTSDTDVAVEISGLNVSDSVTTSENLTLLQTSFVNVSESVTTSETIGIAFADLLNVSDSVATSESISITEIDLISVSNNVTTSETITINLQAGGISISESVVTSESVSLKGIVYFISVNDLTVTTDGVLVFTLLPPLPINIDIILPATNYTVILPAVNYNIILPAFKYSPINPQTDYDIILPSVVYGIVLP